MEIESLETLFDAAKRKSGSGRPAEAAQIYRKIAEFQDLGEKRAAFFLMAASANQDANDFDEAIADCRSAIAIDPDSSKAWRSLGSALMDAGREEEAEAALIRSIALFESTTAHVYLDVSTQIRIVLIERNCVFEMR